MIWKNIKITFLGYLPYECTAVEEYLEQMAKKGWLLQCIKGAFFKFKKIEPQNIKYSVDILNKISIWNYKGGDEALEYREYCMASGWNYVCGTNKIQVFYNKDNSEVIPIHTDEEERFKSIFKYSLGTVGAHILLILLFIYNIYNSIFMYGTEFSLSSNSSILTTVLMIGFISIGSISAINFFIWSIRAKRKLKENKFVPYNNYKQLKLKNILIKGYTLLLFLLMFEIMFIEGHFYMFIFIFIIIGIVPLAAISTKWIINKFFITFFTNKKRYLRNIIMAIIFFVILNLTSVVALSTSSIICKGPTKYEREASIEKVELSIEDFGYKKVDNSLIYTDSNKSVLAKRIEYSYDNGLSYTILQSKYPWVIEFYQKRLLSRLNKYGVDPNERKTNLPNTIRVYSDMEKKSYVLVSQDKVVQTKNNLTNISDEEFLNRVYKKLFYK